MQVPTLTSNYTNAIIHRKRRLFECFSVENWFVQLSPLTFNCTNEIFHYNTSFFECFALKTPICASVNYYLKLHKCGISPQNTFLVENQLCASAKSDFKLHKCDNTSQNTSFLLFYSEKPICATVNSNFKSHKSNIPSQNTYFWVFFQWKIRFVQVSTLTWKCTNVVFHSKKRLLVLFTLEKQFCASVNTDFKFHKCHNPLQNTSF